MNNMRESDRKVGLGLDRDGHHRPSERPQIGRQATRRLLESA